MTDESIKAFSTASAFFVNIFGLGLVSPTITEILPEDARPAYTIGAQGYEAHAFGVDAHRQWLASWQTLASLHGMLDALRAELPQPYRETYGQIRRDMAPGARQALIDIGEVFRREAGS